MYMYIKGVGIQPPLEAGAYLEGEPLQRETLCKAKSFLKGSPSRGRSLVKENPLQRKIPQRGQGNPLSDPWSGRKAESPRDGIRINSTNMIANDNDNNDNNNNNDGNNNNNHNNNHDNNNKKKKKNIMIDLTILMVILNMYI